MPMRWMANITGGFPSGNNAAGGDFVVQFTISTPVVNWADAGRDPGGHIYAVVRYVRMP